MAYDEALARRVREVIADKRGVTERKMFGGLAFMLRGNMFVGILERSLMARVGPANYERALASPGARQMDFTGKPMRGYVLVDAEGLKAATDLKRWWAFARTSRPRCQRRRRNEPRELREELRRAA